MQSFFKRTTKTLIRLRGCAGWFESSLDAHIRRCVFSLWVHIFEQVCSKTCKRSHAASLLLCIAIHFGCASLSKNQCMAFKVLLHPSRLISLWPLVIYFLFYVRAFCYWLFGSFETGPACWNGPCLQESYLFAKFSEVITKNKWH